MTTHIFTLETWFMNRNEDWDCDCDYLLIRDGVIETRTHGSGATFFRDKLRVEFPDAIWHKECLSIHRGKLEPRGLQGLDDKLIAVLRSRFAFKEEPARIVVA